MKKIIGLTMAILLVLGMTGCTTKKIIITKETVGESIQETVVDGVYQKNFGSYKVAEGWVESQKHSSDGQYFYVQEGHEDDEQPDNIAIRAGSNRYAIDDHASFKDAIMTQIMQQLDGVEGVTLTGDGSYTAQDYVLYTFTIDESDTGIKTVQYYIVGDYKYCLIHSTNFTGEAAVDEVAKQMCDSFIWEE
ncbi:MAG: hypothetical protein EOM34_05620 [Clostridia bacterium]|nr:hypothetical protein [Lachnospiraceae bacterium]NCC00140.1 hypothetical protein [Clostridia bacterium]NCD01598.1 hypothetical protein [Clostridia bacterium]